jgi:hypothetical protein
MSQTGIITLHEKLRLGVKAIELENRVNWKMPKNTAANTRVTLSGKICQGTSWPGFSDKIRLEFDGGGIWTRLA